MIGVQFIDELSSVIFESFNSAISDTNYLSLSQKMLSGEKKYLRAL